MDKEKNKLSFSQILLHGLSIWLIGGIIFWLTELLFILIGLPQSWDYKFLRDGMSVLNAIKLTLLPEKISMAFLIYSLISFLGGAICSCIVYFVFRKRTEIENNALIISIFLTFSFFIFSSSWLNTKYLLGLLTIKGIIFNSILIIACIMLTYICFKLFSTKNYETFFSIFVALAFSIDFFMFGELFLLKSFSVRIFSIKGIALSIGLIVVSFGLFYVVRVMFRLKPFNRFSLYNVKNWVFSITAVLVLFSGLVVIIEEDLVNYAFGKEKKPISNKPNIVLIVMDTARVDRFSCYGYGRNTTPHIDKIAREGVLFKNVISPSSWTLPSHASIFTGLFPSEHGAGHVSSYLSKKFETMAEILKKEGYKTLAYTNNPWVSFYTGIIRKFDDLQESWKEKEDRYFYEVVYNRLLKIVKRNDPNWLIQDHGAAKTTQYVSRWIEKNSKSPFFVFINYMEPHLPYMSPPPYNSRYISEGISPDDIKKFTPSPLDVKSFFSQRQRSQKELSVIDALYDGQINYLDSKIGELYEFLKKLKILDNTLLIITSDHGENLGDHGVIGHYFGLYKTLIDIPLIIRYPKYFDSGLVITNTVQPTDIFYTVLDAVEINHNLSNNGLSRSLIKRIKANDYSEIIIAEHDRPTNVLHWAKNLGLDANHINKDLRAIIFNGSKYIQSSKGDEELYNLIKDPDELHNIVSEHPDLVSILRDKLTELNKKVKTIDQSEKAPQMDKETIEKLKSLGYIK